MATFSAGSAFDYRNIIEFNESFDFTKTSSGSGYILTDGFIKYQLTGTTSTTDANLTYVPGGAGFSGMLGSLSTFIGESGYFSLSGASYNMASGYYDNGYSVDGKTLYRLTAELANMLRGSDTLNGSVYADRLAGFAGNDTIKGNGGHDWLEGWSGNDVLYGGTGKDTLVGGAGYDIFVFNTALSTTNNVDLIKDFNPTYDTIRLENAIFTKLTATGTLSSASFVSNNSPVATATNDYILHDKDGGKLYYDADGSGSGVAVQFATIGVNLTLTNADFVII